MPSLAIEHITSADARASGPQPAGLVHQLHPFQRQGLGWMKQRETAQPQGGILADEIGLGKTVEVIALIKAHRRPGQLTLPKSGATLIVIPMRIAQQWKDELEKHAPSLSVHHFLGSRVDRKSIFEIAKCDVILATYEVMSQEYYRANAGLAAYPALLHTLDLWRVVLDEVQYATGGRNAGKVVRLLDAANRWAVSGTPMRRDRPDDLTPLLTFVCGEDWLAEKDWEGHVARLRGSGGGVAQRKSLVALLTPLFLRRTKAAVNDQLGLPSQITKLRYVTPTAEELGLRKHVVVPNALAALDEEETTTTDGDKTRGTRPRLQIGDETLSTHLRLSSISPQLWMQWGSAAPGGRAVRKQAATLVGGIAKLDKWRGWQTLEKVTDADLKKKCSDLRIEVKEGLAGFLPIEPFRGIAVDRSAERKRQHKEDMKRRMAGGAVAALDLTLLQLLVTTSTLARLAPSQTAKDAMLLVFEILASKKVKLPAPKQREKGDEWPALVGRCSVWADEPARRNLLESLHPEHANLPPGNHELTVEGESKTIVVPVGVPQRWAELDPFLVLHFRPFTQSEAKKENEDSTGYVIAMKARTQPRRPAGGVWVGGPRARVSRRDDDARRLLCLNPRGATALTFALSMELCDLARERAVLHKTAVKRVPKLGATMDLYPYTLLATDPWVTTPCLDALLASPPRTDEMVSVWVKKADSAKIKRQAKLFDHQRQDEHPGESKYELEKVKYPLHELVDETGYSVERLVGEMRRAADTARKAAEKSRPKVLSIGAERRARLAKEVDALRAHRTDEIPSEVDKEAEEEPYPSKKIEALIELLTELDARGEKAVVFTAFSTCVNSLRGEICHALGGNGAAVSYDTAVTLETKRERLSAIRTFNDSEGCRAIVLRAGEHASGASAAGLTLTAARNVILMDVLTDPMTELQAVGRVHRIGQTEQTTVWHILSRGSIDVVLRHLAEERGEVRLSSLVRGIGALDANAEVDSASTAAAAAAAHTADDEEDEMEVEVDVDGDEDDGIDDGMLGDMGNGVDDGMADGVEDDVESERAAEAGVVGVVAEEEEEEEDDDDEGRGVEAGKAAKAARVLPPASPAAQEQQPSSPLTAPPPPPPPPPPPAVAPMTMATMMSAIEQDLNVQGKYSDYPSLLAFAEGKLGLQAQGSLRARAITILKELDE